tara:strand:+ start:844 stop:1134 length:291 start_codon:yes stop_codon:yes gene_type:complete
LRALPVRATVVAIGAPADPSHVVHNFADALLRIERDGVAKVDLGGRPFRIGQGFINDISGQSPTNAPCIRRLKAVRAWRRCWFRVEDRILPAYDAG